MTKDNPQDTIVAKVNAEELYESQLEQAVSNYRASLKEQGIDIRVFGKDQLHNVRQFMLAKLVEREVLHQEAGEIGHVEGGLEVELQRHGALPEGKRLVFAGLAPGDVDRPARDLEGVAVPVKRREPVRQVARRR